MRKILFTFAIVILTPSLVYGIVDINGLKLIIERDSRMPQTGDIEYREEQQDYTIELNEAIAKEMIEKKQIPELIKKINKKYTIVKREHIFDINNKLSKCTGKDLRNLEDIIKKYKIPKTGLLNLCQNHVNLKEGGYTAFYSSDANNLAFDKSYGEEYWGIEFLECSKVPYYFFNMDSFNNIYIDEKNIESNDNLVLLTFSGNQNNKTIKYDFYLDPSLGFHFRKKNVYIDGILYQETILDNFKKINGYIIPQKFTQTIFSEEGNQLRKRSLYLDEACFDMNISKDLFKIEIPMGTIVQNFTMPNGELLVYDIIEDSLITIDDLLKKAEDTRPKKHLKLNNSNNSKENKDSFQKDNAETPTVKNEGGKPNAVQLVRAVRESENWIHRIDTFYLKFKVEWKRTPEGIEARRTELKEKFPDIVLDPNRYYDIKPISIGGMEYAIDNKRELVRFHLYMDSEYVTTNIWNKKEYVVHQKYFTHDEEYYYFNYEIGRHLNELLLSANTAWFRAQPHSFWFDQKDTDERMGFYGHAEDFVLIGQSQYHGVDCYILECDLKDLPGRTRKWYVGVKDKLLYGNLLLNDKGEKVREFWTLDYKEIAPGCWFPMTQGYNLYGINSDDKMYLEAKNNLKVLEIKIDKELPQKLFEMEFKEGVQVNDERFGAFVTYTYKTNRSDKEWEEIRQEAIEKDKWLKEQKLFKDELIGRKAPEFPEKAEWLNSTPLGWYDLRGKVVILEFWAEWCGPCKNELPNMSSLYKRRDETGIEVIGIHTPGSKVGDIQQVVEKYDLRCPIFIDKSPTQGSKGFGIMSSAFGVTAIPYYFVIDQQGNIAGHGWSISEVLGKAYELANKNKEETSAGQDDNEKNIESDLTSERISPNSLVETLTYIAQGYENNTKYFKNSRITGRIFYVQKAPSGEEIEPGYAYPAMWYDFVYISKDGKRRLEHDQIGRPERRYYLLDNNKRLLAYSKGSVRVFPIKDEETTWGLYSELYNAFFRFEGSSGYENVGCAMHTYINDILAGEYDRENWGISVNVRESGLFEICIKINNTIREYVIDSHKGFNLVRSKSICPTGKYPLDEEGHYEYKQLANGAWVISKGKINRLNRGIVSERIIEVNDVNVTFEAADELFEHESLDIPAFTYMIDYHFSPPRRFNIGSIPDVNILDILNEKESSAGQD